MCPAKKNLLQVSRLDKMATQKGVKKPQIVPALTYWLYKYLLFSFPLCNSQIDSCIYQNNKGN